MINYGGSSHPPPAIDDCSSKPFKKRKKPNAPTQTGTPDTATASAEGTMLAMATAPTPSQPQVHNQRRPEEQQQKTQQQQQHHLTPSIVLPPPPPLEVQHRPIEELCMKKMLEKNLHKASTAGSAKASAKPRKPTRRRWTPTEDDSLRKLVVSYGNSWASIAQHMPSRSQRTCRARWHYVLDPSIKRSQWTEEEEQIVVTYHNQYGNKWSKIAKHLDGRSAEAIRNHWNCRRNALMAKWKNVVPKVVDSKTSGSAPGDWQQTQSNSMPPPLAEPFYNKKPTDAAGAEAAAKTSQKDSDSKLAEDVAPSGAKAIPTQPPALYPSNDTSTDRDNWSRVSRGRVFSADACADIGSMPSTVSSGSVCVESQSLILPFSYKPSGASL